jgi:tetratricopeptide (TPR) repeat protein
MLAADRVTEAEREAKLREAARADGEAKATQKAEERRKEAERNLAFARKGNEILGSVFAGLDPRQIASSGRPLQDVLRQNLGQAVKELEGSAIGDPVEVAAMQHTLGVSLLTLGEDRLAAEVLGKAWATRQANLGPDHPDALASMRNLAEARHNVGELVSALSLGEEALRRTEARFGPQHADTLICKNNLAKTYLTAGKVDLALPLFKEILDLHKARFGPKDAATLTSMDNLAMAYLAAGMSDLALPLCAEALALLKASAGLKHPNTLTAMYSLASAYTSAGKPDKALSLFEETLKLREAVLGPDHPHTLLTKQEIDFVRAISSAADRYRVKRAERGPTHIDTLLARRDMAQAYLITNRLDDAERMLVEVLGGMKDRAANDPIVVFTTRLLLHSLGLREQAAPNAWQTFHTQTKIGGVLLGQKHYAGAERLLLRGYEGMKQREKSIPTGSTCLPEALDRLIELYTATNKPDEARKWQAERAKYPPGTTAAPTENK